jgi:hypothetical protein
LSTKGSTSNRGRCASTRDYNGHLHRTILQSTTANHRKIIGPSSVFAPVNRPILVSLIPGMSEPRQTIGSYTLQASSLQGNPVRRRHWSIRPASSLRLQTNFQDDTWNSSAKIISVIECHVLCKTLNGLCLEVMILLVLSMRHDGLSSASTDGTANNWPLLYCCRKCVQTRRRASEHGRNRRSIFFPSPAPSLGRGTAASRHSTLPG